MPVDVAKIKAVSQQLHADMRTDPGLRTAFTNNPVKVLRQRGLDLDHIEAYCDRRGEQGVAGGVQGIVGGLDN